MFLFFTKGKFQLRYKANFNLHPNILTKVKYSLFSFTNSIQNRTWSECERLLSSIDIS